MTTNSPNPVDGDVQALIEYCQRVLHGSNNGSQMEQVYKIALAALTAERCGSLIQAVNPKTGSVNIFYRSRGIESIDPEEIAEWEMQEVEHLYTTPPAQLLRPVELPDAKETKFVYHGGNGAFDCGYESGWNACLAEVQRLNATAQPDEGNDGYVKAFYEIASILGIPAQPNSPRHVFETVMKPKLQDLAATAQPVSDENARIADVLESLLWPNMAIGNKAIILCAIKALRGIPAAPGGQDA